MPELVSPPEQPIGLVTVLRSPVGPYVAELLEPLVMGVERTVAVARPVRGGRWVREQIPVQDVRMTQ